MFSREKNTAARCPSDTGTRMHWVVMVGERCLSHNTIRGAAGGNILMAELLAAKGYLD